jgi:N-acetylglucosaminyl-diphospho-decaprenol L-rhamnosyltransferase
MEAVIVTHDSAGDLRALVDSQVTLDSFDRIVVVDNASSDESAQVASEAGFEVVSLPINRGLAFAVNLGASRTRGPSFVLLNPDVRMIARDDMGRLERGLEDPEVGAVAPALILSDGQPQDSARWVPTPLDLVGRRFSGRALGAVEAAGPVDVDWAVAACLVIRRTAWDRIGGFDEGYFLYFEDVDFGVRLRAAGYRLRYDPTVRIRHDHRAASRASVRSPATRHHIRSAIRFYRRHPASLLPRRRRLGH